MKKPRITPKKSSPSLYGLPASELTTVNTALSKLTGLARGSLIRATDAARILEARASLPGLEFLSERQVRQRARGGLSLERIAEKLLSGDLSYKSKAAKQGAASNRNISSIKRVIKSGLETLKGNVSEAAKAWGGLNPSKYATYKYEKARLAKAKHNKVSLQNDAIEIEKFLRDKSGKARKLPQHLARKMNRLAGMLPEEQFEQFLDLIGSPVGVPMAKAA